MVKILYYLGHLKILQLWVTFRYAWVFLINFERSYRSLTVMHFVMICTKLHVWRLMLGLGESVASDQAAFCSCLLQANMLRTYSESCLMRPTTSTSVRTLCRTGLIASLLRSPSWIPQWKRVGHPWRAGSWKWCWRRGGSHLLLPWGRALILHLVFS